MKKIFYLASIAALALSSCAKDQTTEAQIDAVNGGAKITAAMAADDTRTSLEKVDGKYEFRWSAGDQLGVYGVGGGLNNAAFVLNNNSDGQAVGVFSSQNTELKADKSYVAVYPRFQTSLFSAADITAVKWDNPADPTPSNTDDDIWYPNYENVKVNIPAVQKYQPETFYTQTVPAVSTTFTVGNDGAEVSMQPVVDYLFVNIKSTEPIKTLTLGLSNPSSNYDIAGKGELTKYILNGEYRYMLNQISEDKSQYITLEMDEASAAVTCHSANTYVFAVPAGILGMNNGVRAYLYVNKTSFGDNWDFAVAEYTLQGKQMVTNAQLNYYVDNKGTATTSDDVLVSRKHATTSGKYISRLENTVFWANPLEKGVRTTFEYNPNGDVIIENEVELLRYINQYNIQNDYPVQGIEEAEEQYYGKDAFLCADGSFDFSLKNMMELATEYENTEFEPYIAAYLADVEKGGGFPCFYEYENNFIGNGAVIENIEQPLLNKSGIFGGPWYGYDEFKNWELVDIDTRSGELVETENGKASITNITFANVVAATVEMDYDYADGYFGEYEFQFSGRGYILAGEFDGTIKNVTVKNADAEAIMGDMTVANYNGLTIEGVSKLANIADYLVANASLDLTETWNDVKGVQESVFQFIDPHRNAKNETSLYEITIPEGDASTYAKLTDWVNTESSSAVAVVINDVSYWTGDTFAAVIDDKNCVDKNAKNKVYYVKYAEQLAAGLNEDIQLTRSMDLNINNLYSVEYVKGYPYAMSAKMIPWSMPRFYSIDGADFSVNNVYMFANNSNVAPFDAPVVKNITLNNVYINLATDDAEVEATVPEYVGGLTLGVAGGWSVEQDVVITNATVNGLILDTYRDDDTNNTEANYSKTYSSKIGWLVAKANDAQITNAKVNGVQSTVKGIAGLVADNWIFSSSKFEKATVANVTAPNAALEDFAKFNGSKANYNVMGTAVGLVKNTAGRKADIKFVDCGAPVFLYDAPSSLTVIYNNVEKGSLKNN